MATRYQRCNQKPYIKEEQTTQWPQDTKGVIRSRISKKNMSVLLITPFVSCDHCIVCSSLIYGFWLPLLYLVTILLSVLLWYTASDYTFGILWPLYCLFFFMMATRYQRCNQRPYIKEEQTIQWPQDTMGFIRSLIVLSVLLWYTASYKPHGILWSLYCLSFFDIRLLINPMVSCGHCKEGQTTQWPQDTMGFIRSRISKKDRQHNDHKIP
jgi:hypothetical protein